MKHKKRTDRMIFSDPTHKRIFVFSVILLAVALTFIYLKLFYPFALLRLRYSVLTLRFRSIVAYNRFFLILIEVNFIKLFVYTFSARKAKRTEPDSFPAVTAVIPAYNEEKTIVATVTSVLAADYKKLNVIVVDDGSKDRTLAVLRETFGENPRVTILTKENGGKSSALNMGIDRAKGSLLLLLDADTMIAKDSVRLLVPHFKNPKVAAVSASKALPP